MDFYYCHGERTGCAWDVNDNTKTTVLPMIKDVCRSIADLEPLPDTEVPTECAIALDVQRGQIRRA